MSGSMTVCCHGKIISVELICECSAYVPVVVFATKHHGKTGKKN